MKHISILLSFIMLLSLCLTPASAEDYKDAYSELTTDAYREAYRLLEEGIAGMAPTITFSKELGIRYLDLRDIARAVCLDHPEYFWFLESWFYEYSTDGHYLVDTITPTYYLDHQQVSAGSQALADAMIAFHEKVDEIITGIPINCTTDYEIALYLHDYLAQHVTYTLEGDHDSAYAALIHGEAACYGYSKAYQYLLSRAGVTSRIIVGVSLDVDGNKVGHAWNQVWIDGICYYTDVTWDDLDPLLIHQYFLVSLKSISKDHIADKMFPLEPCDHNIDFYQQSAAPGIGNFTLETSGATAAQHFKFSGFEDRKAVFTCEARFDGDLETWLNSNGIGLINGLGLSYETQISYYSFKDIYYIILSDPAFRQTSRKAYSISLNLEQADLVGVGDQVLLKPTIVPYLAGLRPPVYTSSDPSVAIVDENGMVTAAAPGTATITVTSYDGLVSAQCIITVLEDEPHVHTLRLIGEAAPTCTLDGNDPYYLCTGCYHRFADEIAQTELTDVQTYARSATGHIRLLWQSKGNSHHQVCECGEFIPQTTATHYDDNGDSLCDQCNAQINQPTEPSTGEDDDMNSSKSMLWLLAIPAVLLIVVVIIFLRRRLYW